MVEGLKVRVVGVSRYVGGHCAGPCELIGEMHNSCLRGDRGVNEKRVNGDETATIAAANGIVRGAIWITLTIDEETGQPIKDAPPTVLALDRGDRVYKWQNKD